MSTQRNPVFRDCYALTWRLLFVLILASCGDGEGGAGSVNLGLLHPTPENIPEVTDPLFLLQEPSSGTAQSILNVASVDGFVIGVNEGSHKDMLGEVEDVDISRKAIYYADSKHGEVRFYSFAGDLIGIIGSPGNAPYEFNGLNGLAVTNDGSLLVVWDKARRVQVFRQQELDYTLVSSFDIISSLRSGDICVMHDHVYAIGYSEEETGIVHKYTLAGELTMSFGEKYKSSNPLVRRLLSTNGTLACNENHRVVAHVNLFIPVVTGYSETGTELWRVKLADLRIAPAEESKTDRGRPSIKYPGNLEKGESYGLQLVSDPFADSFMAIYNVRVDRSTKMTQYFSINSQSGKGRHVGERLVDESLPESWLAAIGREHVYMSRNHPFPQLSIYDRASLIP
ncbi:MAG: hypothetical protein F4058_05145 [Rhodothermaceae bacterium]|nr:hypothetical protein [Rhodothermaceae bacterium]MYF63588.1 hypothetical protein [Rhodothermaceae bacterium]MYI84708.1 hypothetical protein [Rhodothermaceae bacterium]